MDDLTSVNESTEQESSDDTSFNSGKAMMITKRRPHRGASSAGELAWQFEDLCRRGIELRKRSLCASFQGGGKYRRTHARSGHDAGCFALGLHSEFVRDALVESDGIGASGLLMEAFTQAVNDICREAAMVGAWSPSAAEEAIECAVRRRVTPVEHKEKGPRLFSQSRPLQILGSGKQAETRTQGSRQNHHAQGAALPESRNARHPHHQRFDDRKRAQDTPWIG